MKKLFTYCLIIFLSVTLLGCLALEEEDFPYDEIKGTRIQFSLDQNEYHEYSDYLENFDIYSETTVSSRDDLIFFYATSFESLVDELDALNESKLETTSSWLEYIDEDKVNFENLKVTYNETYFNDHDLLFYLKFEGNISQNYIHSVTVDDGVLSLNVNRLEGMLTATSQWFLPTTIKKADVIGVSSAQVILRTVAPLQTQVTIFLYEENARYIFLHEVTKDEFKKVPNLKDVSTWTNSINVDIIFNQPVSEDYHQGLLDYLRSSNKVASVGYTGLDFIRVQLKSSYLDAALNKTITLTELLDEEYLLPHLSMNILNFTPLAFVTFTLEKPGRKYAEKLVKDLKKLNYAFLDFTEYDSW